MASAPPPSRPAPRFADLDYVVERPLGSGAGSTILLVRDKASGRRYALKVVKRHEADDQVYIDQALHEFEVARRLNHANLLAIYDCRVRKRWFQVVGVELLMEFVDGVTLDEAQDFDIGLLTIIFIHVASGLRHMHKRGISHGDVKPSNILISRAGAVKVIDFGTAWIKGQDKDRVQGTADFMSPEQASKRIVNEATDIYNLGATMYRRFTGELANMGFGMAALGSKFRARAAHDVNPEVPTELSAIIAACLEPDPGDRPSSITEVRDALIALAKSLRVRPSELEQAAAEVLND